MKLNLFEPRDFNLCCNKEQAEDVCNTANRILADLIDSWPFVYGLSTAFTKEKGYDDTHQARLAFIEPIEKEDPETVDTYIDAGVTLNGENLYKRIRK